MDHATPARFLGAHEATAATPALPADPLLILPPRGRSASQLHRQLPPPRTGMVFSVIIPAKNEATRLPAALAALAAQVDLRGQPLPPHSFEVIVLANNCTDATTDAVRRQARRFPNLALHVAELHLPPAKAHVGCARRLLMDEAAARLARTAGLTGIIASTDADSCVASTWLAAIQAEIAAGADAVGGRILTLGGRAERLPLQRIQMRDTAYRLLCARLEHLLDPAPADPWPRHHQHFGASLALTVRAYRQAGGLPEVRFLEDEALCQAMRRHDLQLRHSPEVLVTTSARRQGRVEVGLSWQLREWQHMSRQQREPQVENPVQLAALWLARRQLRAYRASHPTRPNQELAVQLGLPAAELLDQVQQTATFGVLWEWALATGCHTAVGQQPLTLALRELPRLIRHYQKFDLMASSGACGATATVFPVSRAGTVPAAAR